MLFIFKIQFIKKKTIKLIGLVLESGSEQQKKKNKTNTTRDLCQNVATRTRCSMQEELVRSKVCRESRKPITKQFKIIKPQ